jgi:hypothetical protein
MDKTTDQSEYPVVNLICELLSTLANEGELHPFHARTDPNTGFDGLDELVNDALTIPGLCAPRTEYRSYLKYMDEQGECNG